MPNARSQDKSIRLTEALCASRDGVADAADPETDSDCQTALPFQRSFRALMTESKLIQYLRIPELSNSQSHHNVIEHLRRFRGLPRIHICNKALYPKRAIQDWVDEQTSRAEVGTPRTGLRCTARGR